MSTSEQSRQQSIVRVSIIGIASNVALAAFKAVIGLLTHSIAIVLDAVNNLSDAASSLITIVGTRLASKQADRKHPFGHGRAEYLTTIVIAVIVLWAGLTSLTESLKAIVHPETPAYDTVSLVIVAVAVVAKVVLGSYFKAAGKRLSASALVASGEDATMDAVISASTLVAAGIYLGTGLSLEAWLGAIISAIIIKSGIEILQEALSKVLGERVDDELAQAIKATASSIEGVHGAYDLILTDYGPDRLSGSVHVEVDETCGARDVDRITREIQQAVLHEHGVILHTIGIYPRNVDEDSDTVRIRTALEEIRDREEHVLEVHGLYVDEKLCGATFDLVISFDAPNRADLRDAIVEEMHQRFPGYAFVAVLDADISG